MKTLGIAAHGFEGRALLVPHRHPSIVMSTLPSLHIGEVVCGESEAGGWRHVGLLGTRWTMTGPVYAAALGGRGLQCSIPDEPARAALYADPSRR